MLEVEGEGGGGVCRGQVVAWEGGGEYRVLRRQWAARGAGFEVYLGGVGGGDGPGWVSEDEVQPVVARRPGEGASVAEDVRATTKQPPRPRSGDFLGEPEYPDVAPDGTWLEPDCLCYPRGGMARRAYARCEDGVCRVVACGIPDVYCAINGRTRIGGRTVGGYVYGGKAGYIFLAYKS